MQSVNSSFTLDRRNIFVKYKVNRFSFVYKTSALIRKNVGSFIQIWKQTLIFSDGFQILR